MLALAFLQPIGLAQLRRALPPPHRVWSAASWDDFIAHAAAGRADVIVIDPCADRDRDAGRRASALALLFRVAPPVPTVLYISVTAAAIHAACTFVRTGVAEVVVRGVDDSSGGLAAAVHRASAGTLAARLLEVVGRPFAALPPNVADACHELLRRPERTRRVDDLAAEARTTRRSLDRWLARAGVAPAKRLLACARAATAFHLLARTTMRPSRVASSLGYASARALARDLRSLTGYAPTAIRRGVSAEAFVAALAPQLLRAGPRGRGSRREQPPELDHLAEGRRPIAGPAAVASALSRDARWRVDQPGPAAASGAPLRVYERLHERRRGRGNARYAAAGRGRPRVRRR